MIADAMVAVRCAVCAGEDHEVVCPAAEVRAHLHYLRWFHRRRLRSPSEEALSERADFTQDYATDIVRCRSCGLVFRNPRPAEETIARAYAQDRYGLRRLEALFQSQLALYRPKAAALRRRLPSGARVVEVGSFVGGFLAAGREVGWRMLGVDPGEEVDAFCGERALPVFRGTLARLTPERLPSGWAPGAVDCVAVWNAFDQLPDPEPVVSAARRLLRPGGILALRVPNGEAFLLGASAMRRLPSPFSGWLRSLLAWNNLLAFPYLHGYSLRTLDWLLSWHGFQRLEARPDTLCRLADRETRAWAAWEERVLKLLCRAAARIEALRPRSSLAIAPWLDVYYRVG